jgi:hypothetical protein
MLGRKRKFNYLGRITNKRSIKPLGDSTANVHVLTVNASQGHITSPQVNHIGINDAGYRSVTTDMKVRREVLNRARKESKSSKEDAVAFLRTIGLLSDDGSRSPMFYDGEL